MKSSRTQLTKISPSSSWCLSAVCSRCAVARSTVVSVNSRTRRRHVTSASASSDFPSDNAQSRYSSASRTISSWLSAVSSASLRESETISARVISYPSTCLCSRGSGRAQHDEKRPHSYASWSAVRRVDSSSARANSNPSCAFACAARIASAAATRSASSAANTASSASRFFLAISASR